MSKSMTVPVLVATLGVSACAQAPTSGATQPAATIDTKAHCEANKATAAIGQSPSPEVAEQARLRAGAEIVRTLRHDQIITKEYRVGRLNLVLDANGRIASVNCS
ncbi:MAG TPA: I78 family peptidase inhibitor [Pseudoxanthomonas sp.]